MYSIFSVTKEKLGKMLCIISIVASVLIYKLVRTEQNSVNQPLCIIDQTQRLFLPINKQLHQSSFLRAVFLGIGQIMVDGICIVTFLLWLFKIKNFRLPAALGLYFGIRMMFLVRIQVIQKFQRFPYPFPDTVIWNNPGIPSLFVPYEKTRDFFFSGHTGTMTIIACELLELKYKAAATLSFIGLIYIITMLLATHAHYTPDIFTGFVFSYFCFQLVKKYLKKVDYLVSIPYIAFKSLMMPWKADEKVQSIRYYDDIAAQ